MRIVFNKTGLQVLGALEIGNPDSPENPLPDVVVIGYNPTYHDSFILPSASLPARFGDPRVFSLYKVDSALSPTVVLLKNHIQAAISTPTMAADGASKQDITISVRDSTNAPVTSPSFALNVMAEKGFISDPLVNTVSGFSNVWLYASRDVGSTQIRVTDASPDPVTGMPSLVDGLSSLVTFAATTSIKDPLKASTGQGAIPKPQYAQHSFINFYNGKAVGVGLEIQNDAMGTAINESSGNGSHILTKYLTTGVSGDLAGFNAYRNHVNSGLNPKIVFVFDTNGFQLSDTRFMLGVSKTDISPTGGTGSDVFAALRFEGSISSDFQFVCCDGLGAVSTATFTGFTPADDYLWRLTIDMKNGPFGHGIYVTLEQIGIASGVQTLYVLPLPVATDPMGVFGFVKELAISTISNFAIKHVYIQHD